MQYLQNARLIVHALIAAAVVAGSLFGLASPASALTSTYKSTARQLMFDAVSTYSMKSTTGDPIYFSRGLWVNGDTSCWRCNFGPAVSAASLARRAGDLKSKALAIETFDYAIKQHQTLKGGFAASATMSPNDVDTMFFLNELGAALSELDPLLDSTHRQSWRTALSKGADYLISNGNLAWYTNGNVNIGNTLVMAYAYKFTGDAKYATAYETALNFALAPSQALWPGFGLQYSKVPTAANGSDGAGYLAEKGAGAPGLDIDYLQLQQEFVTQIYLLNQDARILRLANLFLNQLLTRTDTVTWRLDISNGSRHTEPNQYRSLQSSSLVMLAQRGGRSDLVKYTDSQLSVINSNFRYAMKYSNAGRHYEFGLYMPSILEAARKHLERGNLTVVGPPPGCLARVGDGGRGRESHQQWFRSQHLW